VGTRIWRYFGCTDSVTYVAATALPTSGAATATEFEVVSEKLQR
jgi:hypothetical protein